MGVVVMAGKETQQPPATDDASAADAGGRSKLLGRLMIAGFVSGVVIVQVVLAMVFMSSIATPVQSEVSTVEDQVEQEIDQDVGMELDTASATAEVELGDFSVTSYQPSSEVTLRIDFHLFGTVMEDDANEFHKRLERNKNRAREQVIVTVRDAELTDLTDPGLGLIKRRILTKVNHTLGKPLLRTIVISDFSFVEQ
jgi:flagellar FliL protein